MIISEEQDAITMNIHFEGTKLKQVKSCLFLGPVILSHGTPRNDVYRKINRANYPSQKLRAVLRNMHLPIDLRFRLLRFYLLPIVFCESESKTILNIKKTNMNFSENSQDYIDRKRLQHKSLEKSWWTKAFLEHSCDETGQVLSFLGMSYASKKSKTMC